MKPLLFFFFLEVKEKERKLFAAAPSRRGGCWRQQVQWKVGACRAGATGHCCGLSPRACPGRAWAGPSSSVRPLLCSLACPLVRGGLGRSWDASLPWRSRGSSPTAVGTKAGARLNAHGCVRWGVTSCEDCRPRSAPRGVGQAGAGPQTFAFPPITLPAGTGIPSLGLGVLWAGPGWADRRAPETPAPKGYSQRAPANGWTAGAGP